MRDSLIRVLLSFTRLLVYPFTRPLHLKSQPYVLITSSLPHRRAPGRNRRHPLVADRSRFALRRHPRTPDVGSASRHSCGRIHPPPRRPLAPLSAFTPTVVESVVRTPSPFGGRPRSRRHSHPSRQSPLRLLGLPPRRSCRRCSPPCRQCRHLSPPDADPPRPPRTSPYPSGVGRRRSAHFFPTTPTPLASACFCLGLNVCYMPRKKVTFVCLNALFFIHLQCKLFRTLPVLHQLLLRAATDRQNLSLHSFVSP